MSCEERVGNSSFPDREEGGGTKSYRGEAKGKGGCRTRRRSELGFVRRVLKRNDYFGEESKGRKGSARDA